MIKLKLRHLNSEIFQNAIIKMTKTAKFKDFKSSYNMSKIAKQVWMETRMAHDTFSEQIKGFYDVDANGAPLRATPEEVAQTGSIFKIKEGKLDEYIAKLNEMLDIDVEIKCWPVDPETIDTSSLTPQEAAVLEPILVSVDQQ